MHLTALLAAAALLTGCGGDDRPASGRHLPEGLPAEGSLMRLPSGGGAAILLRGDSLTPLEWSIDDGLPPIARGLGTDLEEKIVYAVDKQGRLVGIDLFARRTRTYLAAARQLVATPEGVIFALDSAGRALRFAGRSLTTFRASLDAGPTTLLRAPGTQVAAISSRSGIIQVVGDEGEIRRIDAPKGHVAATWYGDMLAVTTDSGVLFVDPRGKPQPHFVELDGTPIVSTFSPSGHRLYVARITGDVVILAPTAPGASAIEVREMGTMQLPGVASELRIDQSGRWLLVRPAKGDSVWLLDVVRQDHSASMQTRWGDDLPLVSGGRTLVTRDVVAWDVSGSAPVERSRLAGAAGDVFMVVPWAPMTARPPAQVAVAPDSSAVEAPADTVVAAAPETTAVAVTDSVPTPAAPPSPAPAGAVSVYLQVSSSQNADWARAFADQLREGGFPARVLDPGTADEGYRVVVGPYASREEADAAGRRLGRPYFIITNGSGTT